MDALLLGGRATSVAFVGTSLLIIAKIIRAAGVELMLMSSYLRSIDEKILGKREKNPLSTASWTPINIAIEDALKNKKKQSSKRKKNAHKGRSVKKH